MMLMYIWFAVMVQAFMPGGDRITKLIDFGLAKVAG